LVKSKSKINKKLLADQIYETLKSRLINEVYLPGYRLKDRELAREFGVSSIPVREAIRILKAEGFVDIIPYKGAIVADFKNQKYIKDIYEVRIMIEQFSVEKVIKNINSKIIENIEKRLNEIKKTCNKKGYENTFVDSAFHREIVKSAGNPYILNIFDNIKFQLPYLDKNTLDQNVINDVIVSCNSYEDHKKILDYIIAKDVEKAKQEIKNHLTHFIKE